jgi:hypothetical protein
VRLTVLPAAVPSSSSALSKNDKLAHEVQPLMIPVTLVPKPTTGGSHETVGDNGNDRIHSALAYLPSEYQPNLAPPLPSFESKSTPGRATYGSSDKVNGLFALALCGIDGLSVPVEKAVEIQQGADSTGVKAFPRIVVSFKTSSR